VKIALIATYEMGRQPFGLASPAAWLRARGHAVVCLDVSRQAFDEEAVRGAGLVALHVPMHTATRLAIGLIEVVRGINPEAHLCFYGLYAPMNEGYLRGLGVQTILGGEFEEGLVRLAERIARGGGRAQEEAVISLARQEFAVPDRSGLPELKEYAHLVEAPGKHRVTGYTEASRGCKHLCRHCPIVPVYKGAFRVVGREVVLADIRQQVAAGARHITFGDPDFFNGPGHARALVEALHREFPEITYDVTIKVEHLLKHEAELAALRETGCAFVVSAVESLDDAVLGKLEKGHTRADFLRVVELFRRLRMVLQPAFLPFTPWTTLEGYLEMLRVLREQELVENVAPIQLAIRLLIPAGSRLLELPEMRGVAARFDAQALAHPWKHADASVDALCEEVQRIVAAGEERKRTRREIFAEIERAAEAAAGVGEDAQPVLAARAAVPYLNEPWYC
jgi:radical SAM superfamily enzyme YgiQ (UPF0313 family)